MTAHGESLCVPMAIVTNYLKEMVTKMKCHYIPFIPNVIDPKRYVNFVTVHSNLVSSTPWYKTAFCANVKRKEKNTACDPHT